MLFTSPTFQQHIQRRPSNITIFAFSKTPLGKCQGNNDKRMTTVIIYSGPKAFTGLNLIWFIQHVCVLNFHFLAEEAEALEV